MHYAIKTLKKEHISNLMYKFIINEVRFLRNLDHPNLVKYHETIEDESYIHIVMEYLEEKIYSIYIALPN